VSHAPDLDEVCKGAQAVRQAYLGPFHVSPANRDFNGLQPTTLRNEKILYVEAESIQLLLRKNGAGGGSLKQLESALGVVERQSSKSSHHKIEKTSGILAEHRLMH